MPAVSLRQAFFAPACIATAGAAAAPAPGAISIS